MKREFTEGTVRTSRDPWTNLPTGGSRPARLLLPSAIGSATAAAPKSMLRFRGLKIVSNEFPALNEPYTSVTAGPAGLTFFR